MTSITSQKQDLKELIHKTLMERFQKMTKQKQEDAFLAVVMRYSGTMTLSQLEQWHLSLHVGTMIKECKEG